MASGLPKSGINPWACTPGGIANNFQEVIKELAGSRLLRFRLVDKLDTGSNATAVTLEFDGSNYVEKDTIEVFDHYELTTTDWPRGMWQAGTAMEGYCLRREKPAVEGRLEGDIVWMEQFANHIEFTLTSVFSGGEATATVDASWGQGCDPGASLTVHDDQGNYDWAEIGDKGVAARSEYADETSPTTPYYKVIELIPGAGGEGGWPGGIVFFKLNDTDLEIGGGAQARVLSGDAPVGTIITVHDPHTAENRGMFGAPLGATGFAKRRNGSQTDYNIIWMGQKAFAVEFTLTANLSSGSASATVDYSWHQGISPGSPITVFDDAGRFTDSITGCKGIAWRDEYEDTVAAPHYRVVSCQRAADRATALLTANMCADAPAFNSWSIEPHDDSTVDPGAPAAIGNEMLHRGQSGDIIWVVRTDKVPPFTWQIRDVEKKSQYVVFDIRLNGSYIQTYGTNCAVEYCISPDWTDKIPVDDCA